VAYLKVCTVSPLRFRLDATMSGRGAPLPS
jgi:hypothetical protein